MPLIVCMNIIVDIGWVMSHDDNTEERNVKQVIR